VIPVGVMVFDHDTRKMIYNHILTYPGVSFKVLKNIFNLNVGTLRYHLEYLEKAERILLCKENGQRCYYPLKNEIVVSELFENKPRSYKFTKTQQRILNIINRNPGISQKELIKKTGLSRFTISYNMRKFVDIGLIKKSNNEKSVYYEYMTDELLRREIFLRLTIEFLNKEIDEKTFNDLKAKLGIDEPDES
jgi:predicted transcriptional regulator